MMKQHLHGTTNVRFVFGEGIMLGSGAIITTSYTDEGGTEYNELLSDQEVTIFQLCSKPKIYCTLMGDVKEWHEMYRHLLELEPQSVRASFDCAKKYLNDFLKKNRRSGNSFGTIIAGYHKEEGFQILGVSLDKKKVRQYTDREFSIGSGGFFADLVLLKTNADGYANMTKEVAVNVAFEALLQGSLKDYCSGGILRVTYVHKDGCIFITYRVLDVYKTLYKTLYDSADKEEQATLFLLYSTSFGPIFGGDNIQALISDIWSGGLKSIIHSNIIAKKACFYVHRIVLKDEKEAIKAYDDISTKNARPIYPQALAHIRSYLIDCVREKTREHVYIGRSSKELLEGICMLKDADTLNYQGPIGDPNEDDRLIWPFKMDGDFSVRSCYRWIPQQCIMSVPMKASTSHIRPPKIWPWIWHSKFSPKVSDFLWRAITNFVPSLYNLFKRKVRKSPMCSICGEYEESIKHCLLLCPWTELVWFGSRLGVKIAKDEITTLDTCQVFKAREIRSGEIVALKRIRMDNEKEGFPITAIQKIKLLKKLHHENIIKLEEFVTSAGPEKNDQENQDSKKLEGGIYMVSEYMDHNLTGLADRPGVRYSIP